jgi:GNAT superfamily N-acetyltransferase
LSILIKQANATDWNAIKHFIDEAYGPVAPYKGHARWNWQFLANPFGARNGQAVPIWIAKDGEKVIGQIAVQPAALQLDGVDYPAGWMVDVMILPDYRGQSLGHRLHAAVAEGIPLLAMLTMAPATRKMAERAGCVTLGPVRLFTKLNNLKSDVVRRFLLKRTVNRSFFHLLAKISCDVFHVHQVLPTLINPLLRAYNGTRPSSPPDAELEIVEIEAFGDDIDQFWSSVRGQYPASFTRNARFLNWRFKSAPDLRYRCFIARKANQIVGYVVLRHPSNVELPLGTIADLLASPTDTKVIKSLILHAISVFENDVVGVKCVSSLPEIDRILREVGFLSTRVVHPTIVCRDTTLRRRVGELKDQWYFTKCDHDWDQIIPE